MTTILPFPDPHSDAMPTRDPDTVDRIACSTCRNKTFLIERSDPTQDWAVVCPACQNQIAASFTLLECENPGP